jgi:hypothetical protein
VRVDALEVHRVATQEVLDRLGLTWRSWPGVLTDPRLSGRERLSGVLVLLGTAEADAPAGPLLVAIDPDDDSVDWLGRQREPWKSLARSRLPWTVEAATTALTSLVAGAALDERRFALALTGAAQVCAEGPVDESLLEAVRAAADRLEAAGEDDRTVRELGRRARRILAAATHPDILDLSMVVDGDGWGPPARAAAHQAPTVEVTALVRALGALGPRKPPQRWWRSVEEALASPTSRALLHRWLELAAAAEVVPEWPGARIGHCRGVLFIGTNNDLVRAAALATVVVPEDQELVGPLATLARRGAAHNGMAGMPDALALKVASAAVDALVRRGGQADRAALRGLVSTVHRRDLQTRILAALDDLDALAQDG